MFRALDARYVALLYALVGADIVLRVFNWRALLEMKTGRLPLGGMLRAYLVGGFLGSVIPSSLGADVSRSVVAAQLPGVRVRDAALAMMVLNLLGLVATCIMALFGSLLLLAAGGDRTIPVAIVPACVAFLVLFPFLLRGWTPDATRPGWPRLERVLAKINAFSTALRAFSSSPGTLASVLGIALLNQFLGIMVVFTLSLALDTKVALFYCLAFVPIVAVSRLIPLSVAGLGAEQGVFVVVFAQAGLPAAQAFLISLILAVVNLSFVLMGGAIFGIENIRGLLRRGTQS